ncbi:MAG: reductive dehalogenase [Candidatus Aminicenantes bacterium]|nr:reductive dehalogenase [Candidatus Aminicenantes bacterium]
MRWFELLGWGFELIIALGSVLFIAASLKERALRAGLLGLAVLGAVNGVFIFLLLYLEEGRAGGIIILDAILILLAISLLMPIGKKLPLQVVAKITRIDERDIPFSRIRYEVGSPIYEQYYTLHPEVKGIYDRIRQLPGLAAPGTPTHSPLGAPLSHAQFDFLEELANLVNAPSQIQQVETDPLRMSAALKETIKYMGAKLIGVAELNQDYVYTHIGRRPGKYGQKVELTHKYAIIFAVEMDYKMIRVAPALPVIIETGRQYIEAARIALVIACYIRRLGYPARAHIDANYQAMLPPVAVDAGLGEIGRNNILITRPYGARVRLGMVTTDLPLLPDKPILFGVQDFCHRCRKCADNCPSKAISPNKKKIIRGIEKWEFDPEKCFAYWNSVGTDCALCINTCPFSKPDNLLHRAIRYAVDRSAVARQLSLWMDDLFYGRTPRSEAYPKFINLLRKEDYDEGL